MIALRTGEAALSHRFRHRDTACHRVHRTPVFEACERVCQRLTSTTKDSRSCQHEERDNLLIDISIHNLYPGQVAAHPLRGVLFESLVVAEMLKRRFNNAKSDNLFFFRDNLGNEVDILLEQGLQRCPGGDQGWSDRHP